MTTKSPYAHIYQWLADGEQIQREYTTPDEWAIIGEHTALKSIMNRVPPGRFRLAPKTLTINGVTFPEPMREAPPLMTHYFIVDLGWAGRAGYVMHVWRGDQTDLLMLSHGLCHSTKEAAELHAKALLSFTEVAK